MARASTKRSYTSKPRPARPLTAWNKAMKEATKQLRAENPTLKGPELFKQGAVLAHKLIETAQAPRADETV